jgi:hypothetical protein
MSEPRRWSEEGPPALVGQLISAASNEQPPAGSLSRSLSRLGVAAGAAGTVATTGAASSASTAVAKATLATIAPWVKWTVLVGVVSGTGGAWVATRAPAAAHDPAVLASKAKAPAPLLEARHPPPSAPSAEMTVSPAKAPAPTRPPAARKREGERSVPSADAERLAEEVQAVDRARALVAAGRASDALAALDDYERRFPIRRFAPEGLYLKMEALLGAGQRGAARDAAARLLSQYPKSPQAPRARQVLGGTNP